MKTTQTKPPLFIPLKREFFEAFARGEKHQEYRPWGPRWNERTCEIGRQVVLSLGYGTGRRLVGDIVARLKHDAPEYLPGWKECYGSREGSACVITISIDRAATEALGWSTLLFESEATLDEMSRRIADINLPPYPAGGFIGTSARMHATKALLTAKTEISYLRRQLAEYCDKIGIYTP